MMKNPCNAAFAGAWEGSRRRKIEKSRSENYCKEELFLGIYVTYHCLTDSPNSKIHPKTVVMEINIKAQGKLEGS